MVIQGRVIECAKSVDVCRVVVIRVAIFHLELASSKILANLNSVVSVLQRCGAADKVNLNKVRGKGIHEWCA